MATLTDWPLRGVPWTGIVFEKSRVVKRWIDGIRRKGLYSCMFCVLMDQSIDRWVMMNDRHGKNDGIALAKGLGFGRRKRSVWILWGNQLLRPSNWTVRRSFPERYLWIENRGNTDLRVVAGGFGYVRKIKNYVLVRRLLHANSNFEREWKSKIAPKTLVATEN